ncbi:MAG: amidohydrolase [Bacteroidales bacterium]|nr:amidohydrolase [Bacteroidales bacterium]
MIVLKSVYFQSKKTNVIVKGNRFTLISEELSQADVDGAEVVDCDGLAIFPAFYNAHCHAAMTLFRGYADDKPLFEWLNNYIWPIEAKLNDYYVEAGSRLAVLEMIKSGTVFFSDMYYFRETTMKVVEEMGIRATIGVTIADALTPDWQLKEHFKFLENHTGVSDRVQLAVMPHAIYTNTAKTLQKCVSIATSEQYKLHIHLSETAKEVADCIQEHSCTPVEYLDSLGALNEQCIAAHCVHFTENDFRLFANSGASAVVNPCSNLKLQSGIPNVVGLREAGIPVALGTDGASSNNNLDMREEMKVLALIANVNAGEKAISQQEILQIATEAGAKAYGLHDAGRIEVGYLADCLLVDMNTVGFCPNNNVVSNWIYGASSEAIHSVICNGKFVMKNRHIDGEEDIVKEANKAIAKMKSEL